MNDESIIEHLLSLIDDQVENIQYADDDEKDWRENCITALEAAIEHIEQKKEES